MQVFAARFFRFRRAESRYRLLSRRLARLPQALPPKDRSIARVGKGVAMGKLDAVV